MTDRAAKPAKSFEEWIHVAYSFVHPNMIAELKPCWDAATRAAEERQEVICRQCNKSIESDKSRFIGKVSK
jgi:hypothetical protein